MTYDVPNNNTDATNRAGRLAPSLNKLSDAVEDLDLKNSSLNNRVTVNEDKVDELVNTTAGLNSSVNSLEPIVNSNRDKISQLELKDTVTSQQLNSAVNPLQATLSNHDSRLNNLDMRVDSVDGRVDNSNGRIATLEAAQKNAGIDVAPGSTLVPPVPAPDAGITNPVLTPDGWADGGGIGPSPIPVPIFKHSSKAWYSVSEATASSNYYSATITSTWKAQPFFIPEEAVYNNMSINFVTSGTENVSNGPNPASARILAAIYKDDNGLPGEILMNLGESIPASQTSTNYHSWNFEVTLPAGLVWFAFAAKPSTNLNTNPYNIEGLGNKNNFYGFALPDGRATIGGKISIPIETPPFPFNNFNANGEVIQTLDSPAIRFRIKKKA